MIYRFYNHTPMVLVATNQSDKFTVQSRKTDVDNAAAAIFTGLMELDSRTYRELKRLMDVYESVEDYRGFQKSMAERVKHLKEG